MDTDIASKINILKKFIKEEKEYISKHTKDLNSAKFRIGEHIKNLERLEAKIICSCCKNPIGGGHPYITDRQYVYCSQDCKASGQVKEQEGIEALEGQRQGGTV